MKSQEPIDYNKPVAYDTNGRPLYAHPADAVPGDKPQQMVVQMTRTTDPVDVPISDEAKARHAESNVKYPRLNLSEGEYVISEVRRHPIGMFGIVFVAALLIFLIIAGLLFYPTLQKNSVSDLPPIDGLLLPAGLSIVLVLLGAYIGIWVFRSNRMYLTNESVIQEIQTTLLARREQTITLESIEDASYRQTGIIQTLFDYGMIRLSTVGGETTYRLTYVAYPRKQIAVLNDAVEDFKNGRPVKE